MELHLLVYSALLPELGKRAIVSQDPIFIKEFIKMDTCDKVPVHGGRGTWRRGIGVQMNGGRAVAGESIVDLLAGGFATR